MYVAFEIPEEVAAQLTDNLEELPRRALEALAVEGYRSGKITAFQVQKMLGLNTRLDTDTFLKRTGAFLDYTGADLEQDVQTIRGVLGE
jgi:hypothetical protein